MPSKGGSDGPAGRIGVADRADAPRPVAGADPGVRADGDVLSVDSDGAAPGADLGEPLCVEGDPAPGAHHVALLLEDVEGTLPGQVAGDALGLLEHQPQLAERLDDLDPVAADVLVETVVVDLVGQVYGRLGVAPAEQHECVLDPQVGVVAGAGDQEDVTAAVVGVEIAAVVEVPVAGRRPGDRQRSLVERELVEGTDHVRHRPRPAGDPSAACDGTASRRRRASRSRRSAPAGRRCA